jgi:hypothetical protein
MLVIISKHYSLSSRLRKYTFHPGVTLGLQALSEARMGDWCSIYAGIQRERVLP